MTKKRALFFIYYLLVGGIFIYALFHKSLAPVIGPFSKAYFIFLLSYALLFFLIFPLLSAHKKLFFGTLLLSVLLVETISAFALIVGDNIPRFKRMVAYSTVDDKNLGYVLIPNDTHTGRAFSGDKLIYEATYRTDTFARRTVGQEHKAGQPHLILLGGSFAFGEGLNDTETLQHHLSKHMPEYNVFNYAVHGYGPQNILALLKERNLSEEVFSKNGVAVYIYGYWHIYRAIGTFGQRWLVDSPYYTLNANGNLIRKGSFRTGRFFETSFHGLVDFIQQHSFFLKLIKFNWPSRVTFDDLKFCSVMFKAIETEYKKKLGGEFYVYIHPLDQNHTHTLQLIELLKNQNIKIIYYNEEINKDEYIIPIDGHPNEKMNRWVSENLAAYFRQNEN